MASSSQPVEPSPEFSPSASVPPPPPTPPTCSSASSSQKHDQLERRSSKSRLSKQSEVEVETAEEDATTTTTTSAIGGEIVEEDGREGLEEQEEAAGSLAEEGGEGRREGGSPTRAEHREEEEEPARSVTESEENSPKSDTSYCTIITTDLSVAVAGADDEEYEMQENVDKESNLEMNSSNYQMQALFPKVKLVRSQAVCDDASPPPELFLRTTPAVVTEDTEPETLSHPIHPSSSTSSLTVSPTVQGRRHDRQKLGQGSSQGSTISDDGTSPATSRDSSFDTSYTDTTGTNLEEFIVKTLNKNRNDRTMLLRLEGEMTAFIADLSQERRKFPQMSSYHRMLVHRVAAFFGLDHNIDESGKCVIVNRLSCTRLPDFKFCDHICDDLSSSSEDQPKKSILKRHRDCTSLEENLGVDRISLDDRKSKSFEERADEYQEARNRIFQKSAASEMCKIEEPCIVGGREIRLKGGVGEERGGGGVRSSKEDLRWHSDVRPWSSTDSSGYSTDGGSYRLRLNVTKASSFHGVTVLTRGDSRTSTLSSGSRFSKNDSISSGISNLGGPFVIPPTIPSSPPLEGQLSEGSGSSGASGQSGASPSQSQQHWQSGGDGSPFLPFTDESGEPLAIWVASTISQIPSGSIIINPQSGEPYINQDGSLYRWYPPTSWIAEKERSRKGGGDVPSILENVEEVLEAPYHPLEEPHDPTQLQGGREIGGRAELTNPPVVVQSSSRSTFKPTKEVTSSTATAILHQQPVAAPLPRQQQQSPVVACASSSPQQQPMFIIVPGNGAGAYSPGKAQMVPAQQMYMTAPPPPPHPPALSHGHLGPGVAGLHPVRFACPPHGGPGGAIPGPPGRPGTMMTSVDRPVGYAAAAPMLMQSVEMPYQHDVGGGYAATHQASSSSAATQFALVPQQPSYGNRSETWNVYQQQMTPFSQMPFVAGGQNGGSTPVYYAVEGGQAAMGHGGSMQLIVVSSAPGPDVAAARGQVVYSGHPVAVGTGASSSLSMATNEPAHFGMATLPPPPPPPPPTQYVQYTYPSGPFLSYPAGLPILPSYQGVMPGGVLPPRGPPAQCFVPVARPKVGGGPTGGNVKRSPSPKTVPAAASGTTVVRLQSIEYLPRVQQRTAEGDPGRETRGLGVQQLPRPPALLAAQQQQQQRLRGVRPSQTNITCRPPVVISTGDMRFPRVPLHRIVCPSPYPQSSFIQQSRLVAVNVSESAQHGTSGSMNPATLLEVCNLPPGLRCSDLESYLEDLVARGARWFHVVDGDESSAGGDATYVGSAGVVAVFDSAADAERALAEQSGTKYRLRAASKSYGVYRS